MVKPVSPCLKWWEGRIIKTLESRVGVTTQGRYFPIFHKSPSTPRPLVSVHALGGRRALALGSSSAIALGSGLSRPLALTPPLLALNTWDGGNYDKF